MIIWQNRGAEQANDIEALDIAPVLWVPRRHWAVPAGKVV